MSIDFAKKSSYTKNMKNIFGQNLRKLRKNNGLLQKELAEDLGVTISAISLWEKGTCLPATAKLNDIAIYFNVTSDELLGLEPIKKEPANLSSEESELIEIYRNATDSDRSILMSVARKFSLEKEESKRA